MPFTTDFGTTMKVKNEPWNAARTPMHRKQCLLCSGVTVTTVVIILMFSVSLACVRCRTPPLQCQSLPGFREGGDVKVRSTELIWVWLLILTRGVTFDALPWTLVYPLVKWVLDFFRGAVSIHLVVVCKNINFHLLFFINKRLWTVFNLICCHKQPHINLLWTYGVR